MGFLVVLVAVIVVHHWWDRRRVRDAIAAYGHVIERVRWVPLELRLNGGRVTTFQVTYAARDGSRWRCRVEARLFGELSLDEPLALDAPVASSGGAAPATVLGVVPRRAPDARRFLRESIGCALACFLLLGATYWTANYRDLQLPSSLCGPALLAVVASAAVLRRRFADRAARTFAMLTGAVVLVVMLRIAVDLGKDPTSHNLWPFEVVLAAFVGAVASGVGLGIGFLLRRR